MAVDKRTRSDPMGPSRLVRNRGRCFGNATMEAFWARLQVELLNTRRWATTIELASAMADYIDNFYDVERRHSYLGNISPTEFETLWTSTYSMSQLG
jgi:putative transposase